MRHEQRDGGIFIEANGRLARAIEDGHERDAFRAIEDGASLSPDGNWNPLAKAFDLCRTGDDSAPRMITLLLSMGADPTSPFEWPREGYSATCAEYAVSRLSSFSRNPSQARDAKALESLTLLLEAGSAPPPSTLHVVLDPSFPSAQVSCAIKACSKMGLLPEIGDFIRAMERADSTALEELAWSAPSSSVRDRAGLTPLHHAAQDGNDKAVEVLLDAGAAVDTRALDGSTPLMAACSSPRATEKICAILLRWGADPIAPNKNGVSALEMAFARGSDTRKAFVLADRVASRGKQSRTALDG